MLRVVISVWIGEVSPRRRNVWGEACHIGHSLRCLIWKMFRDSYSAPRLLHGLCYGTEFMPSFQQAPYQSFFSPILKEKIDFEREVVRSNHNRLEVMKPSSDPGAQ